MSAGSVETYLPILFMGLLSLLGLGVFVLYVVSIVWAYGDAERRGKSGCLVAILVAVLSWPVGLIIWLVARPEDRPRA